MVQAKLLEDKLIELIEVSADSLLTDFTSLVKDFYLTGRGDSIISPHSFLLSLTLAVYDCFTGGGSNAVPTGNMSKLQAINGAEDNNILCNKYSRHSIVNIPKAYFERIFYALGKEYGDQCFTLYTSRREKSISYM